MRVQKKTIRANRSRRVMANDAIDIAPEATELLFEAEDVAEVVAEFTGEDVTVEVVEDGVEFTAGDDTVTVEPEGDEELLEASTRIRGRRSVKASTRRPARRPARRR